MAGNGHTSRVWKGDGRKKPISRTRESAFLFDKSTHSTTRSEVRGMLRVDTERRFLPRFKNRGLVPSNVSTNNSNITVPSPPPSPHWGEGGGEENPFVAIRVIRR
jgi:hypothetical protein